MGHILMEVLAFQRSSSASLQVGNWGSFLYFFHTTGRAKGTF